MKRPTARFLGKPIAALVALAPLPLLAQITPGTIHTGNGTSYTLSGTGAGALAPSEVNDHYAALNAAQWEGSAWCGAWVEVTGPAGTTLVQIVDLYPEGTAGALDLGPVPFQEITGGTAGIHPISWRLVSAPGDRGSIHFYSQGSNPYYLKLQAANIVNPVASMEILHSGSYVAMTRTADNHFVFSQGVMITEPFTIRVTDIFENQVVSGGLTIPATAGGQNGSGNFPAVVDQDILIEQPAETPVSDGGTVGFGFSVDAAPQTRAFTIRNRGTAALTGIAITKGGANAADFTVTASPPPTLAAGTGATFTLSFATAAHGTRSAEILVSSSTSVPELASYDIHLTGTGLSSAADTDGDGLNDGAEARLAALGFDWQLAQPALVQTYYQNAGLAGLFTPAQVGAMHVGTPLLERDRTSGRFTLGLRLRKSADLQHFEPFPFAPSGLTIGEDGGLEYEFELEGDAAFLRVEAD